MLNKIACGLLVLIWAALIPVQAENLFDADNYQAVVADKKAYRVGDLLTVIVVESAKAESSAGTGTETGMGFRGGVSDSVSDHDVGVSVSGSAKGDAKTTRKGQLTTTLTVQVIDKDQHGNLQVSGTQNLVINGEAQSIVLKAQVRPYDIAPDNTVLSSRLAHAEIQFSGDGIISDAQKAGIVSRFFRWLGLL